VKAYLRHLMLFALLLIPAQGQSAASPSPARDGNTSSESVMPAADQGPVAPAAELQDSDTQSSVLRAVGGLGLVVFLMIGTFFAAKKYAPRYFSKPASQKNLKILETLAMGDRRSISLIEVGGSRFLVGNTPQQINLLAALPEPVSLVSEPDEAVPVPKAINKKGSGVPFRSLFEVEKSRPTQRAGHPLPDDLRVKMRQLRDALERS
jgi:flagellar biosynthetic protein FliO